MHFLGIDLNDWDSLIKGKSEVRITISCYKNEVVKHEDGVARIVKTLTSEYSVPIKSSRDLFQLDHKRLIEDVMYFSDEIQFKER